MKAAAMSCRLWPRRPVWAFIFLIVVWWVSPPLTRAEEAAPEEGGPKRPEVSVSVDLLSQYVFRGVACSRGSVVLQPSFSVSYRGFSASLWGNFDTDERNPYGMLKPNRKAAKWNETDVTLSYSREILKNLTVSAGVVYYALDSNNSAFDSWEVFGGVQYRFPWLEAGFQVYREVANLPGWFLTWYVSRTFTLPVTPPFLADKPSLTLLASWSAELSLSKAAFPTRSGRYYQSLHAGLVSAGLNIPVHKRITVTPKVMFWYALGGQSTWTLRTLSWDGQHNHILGGVTVAATF